MKPNFGNSSASAREVIITSFRQGFDQKNHFFEGWFWFRFNNLALALVMVFKFLYQCGKRIKTKSQKDFGTIFYVCRI